MMRRERVCVCGRSRMKERGKERRDCVVRLYRFQILIKYARREREASDRVKRKGMSRGG